MSKKIKINGRRYRFKAIKNPKEPRSLGIVVTINGEKYGRMMKFDQLAKDVPAKAIAALARIIVDEVLA